MNERIDWLDIARGLGIILVVLGHTVTTVIRNNSVVAMRIYDTIYFFQVPLLMFVSGLAFSLSYEKYLKKKTGSYILSKMKRLILPYVSYSFLVYLLFTFANMLPGAKRVLEKNSFGRMTLGKWIRELWTGNNSYCSHLWYIYSLFVISLLAFLLIKFFGEKYKYALLLIAVFCWIVLGDDNGYAIIWKTSRRGIWFAVGCIVKFDKCFSKKQKFLMIFSAIPVLCTLLISPQIEAYKNLHHLIRRVIEFVPISILLLGLISLSQIMGEYREKAVKYVGRNSFCIYIFHQPFFGSALGAVLYGIIRLPIVACIMISFILCFLVPIAIKQALTVFAPKWLRVSFLGE